MRNKKDRIKMESLVEISIYKTCLTPRVQKKKKSYDMLEPHGLNKV